MQGHYSLRTPTINSNCSFQFTKLLILPPNRQCYFSQCQRIRFDTLPDLTFPAVSERCTKITICNIYFKTLNRWSADMKRRFPFSQRDNSLLHIYLQADVSALPLCRGSRANLKHCAIRIWIVLRRIVELRMGKAIWISWMQGELNSGGHNNSQWYPLWL